jgi:urease accessory protein
MPVTAATPIRTGTTMTTAMVEPASRLGAPAAVTDQRATASLLQILWLASPALPVGGFSYSEGLEAAVDAGLVHDENTAAHWITDQLHLALARADLPVVAQAIPAWRASEHARIRALNNWVLQTRETQEFRLQTEQMGRSLMEWARQLGELGAGLYDRLQAAELQTPTYPVAMACAAASLDASVHDSLVGFAFGWAENMVQAAIKSVPLGQSAGQRMLARLALEIPGAVGHAMALQDHERQAFTPLLAIHSSRHETQYSRLFRS